MFSLQRLAKLAFVTRFSNSVQKLRRLDATYWLLINHNYTYLELETINLTALSLSPFQSSTVASIDQMFSGLGLCLGITTPPELIDKGTP